MDRFLSLLRCTCHRSVAHWCGLCCDYSSEGQLTSLRLPSSRERLHRECRKHPTAKRGEHDHLELPSKHTRLDTITNVLLKAVMMACSKQETDHICCATATRRTLNNSNAVHLVTFNCSVGEKWA